MTSPTTHPQLKKPPVTEAVFEVRYPTPPNYSMVPGRLFDALNELYSEFEDLPAAQLPVEVAPPQVPRHRLATATGDRLSLLGAGSLSLNHVTYRGYPEFRRDAETILGALARLKFVGATTRLGMRYINRIPLDRPLEDLVALKVGAPTLIAAGAVSTRFQWKTSARPVGMLQTTVLSPHSQPESEDAVLLDLDFFLEEEGPFEVDRILDWHGKAHERLYDSFVALLNSTYFSEIQ